VSGFREQLRGASPEQIREALSAFGPEEMLGLKFDWETWARPEQLPPTDDGWTTFLYLAGRGAGKTRSAAEWVRRMAREHPGCRIGVIARTAADARDTCCEGEAGILAVCPPSEAPYYEPSKRRLTWRNGSQATTFSADEPSNLRGPSHHFIWADELATWPQLEETWSNALLGLRLGRHPRAFISTTPRPLKLLRELVASPTTIVRRGSTYSNQANLAPSALAEFRAKYGEVGRLARQELYGELLPDSDEAMFDPSWFGIVAEAPADAKLLRYWDLAATPDEPGKDPDWTVGAKLGLKDGVWYVVDLVRLRGTPMKVECAVRATAERDGTRVPVRMEQEPGSSGVGMIDYYARRVLVGFDFRGDKKTGSKIDLAAPLSAAAQSGLVKLVRAPWNAAFLAEAETFPLGDHDDQIDAVSGAMRFLRRPNTFERWKKLSTW
jgi:predicted phage terminase large subunit-like protein